MDSSSASQSELLVAVAGSIRYKRTGRSVLKDRAQGPLKKPYRKPKLRVYGDIHTLTKGVTSTAKNHDGMILVSMQLKTH
jgi:hypothetical protein